MGMILVGVFIFCWLVVVCIVMVWDFKRHANPPIQKGKVRVGSTVAIMVGECGVFSGCEGEVTIHDDQRCVVVIDKKFRCPTRYFEGLICDVQVLEY